VNVPEARLNAGRKRVEHHRATVSEVSSHELVFMANAESPLR
jgi:hypothetical protein